MAAPQIIIEVAGQGPGAPAVPRTFPFSLVDGLPPLVTLKLASTVGVTSVEWSILDQDENAVAVLSDPNVLEPTFLPTAGVSSTYLVQVIVNGGAFARNGLAFLTENLGIRKPAAAETNQFDALDGWKLAVNRLIDILDAIGGGGGGGAADASGARYIPTGETYTVPENSVLFVDGEDFAIDGTLVLEDGAILSVLPIHGDEMLEQIAGQAPTLQTTMQVFDLEDPEEPEVVHLDPAGGRNFLEVYSQAQVDALVAAGAGFLPLSPVVYDDVTLPPSPLPRNVMIQLSDLFIAPGPGNVVLPTAADGVVDGDYLGFQLTGPTANPLMLLPFPGNIRYLDGSDNSNPVQLSMPHGVMVFRYIEGAWHPFCGTHIERFLRQADGAPWAVEHRETNGGQAIAYEFVDNVFIARGTTKELLQVSLPPNSLAGRAGFANPNALAINPSGVPGRVAGLPLQSLDDRRLWYFLEMTDLEQTGPALGMSVNNLAFPYTSRQGRFTSVVAGCQVTGVDAQAANVDSPHERQLRNDSGTAIDWQHQSLGSTDINRIICPRGVTYRQQTGTSIRIVYSGTRWYLFPMDSQEQSNGVAGVDNGVTVTVNLSQGFWSSIGLTGSRILNLTGDLNLLAGRRGLLSIFQPPGGGAQFTDFRFNGNSVDVVHENGVAPVLSGIANAQDILEWAYSVGKLVVSMYKTNVS